jgi:nitrite reductase (NADH) large subunit
MPRELDQTICFCHNVPYGELLKAIQAGARSVTDIQIATCASTGCGGCEQDVREILEEELSAEVGAKTASSKS